uniref:Cnidarian restricted protein n=2 Tax=Clytia hemisphaerica TaxID=252671 RepID=A0A7M6DRK1_9CNID
MVNFTYLIIVMSISTSGSMLCNKRKNITIIPHIDVDQGLNGDHAIERFFENPTMQLRYFIKSLFEMSCFEVWIYSPIQNLCIHQAEENYVRFLETKWMATASIDDKDIINLLSDIPHSNDQVEQTLFFVSIQSKRSLKTASNFGTN